MVGMDGYSYSEPDNVPAQYAMRELGRNHFGIVKFSGWNGDIQAFYEIYRNPITEKWHCSCAAWKTCKHWGYLFKFNAIGAIDSGRRYEPDTDTWYPPRITMEM